MNTAGPLPSGAARIIGSRFLDLDGEIRRLGDENGAGPVAIVLLDRYCPISTRYAPEFNQFSEEAKRLGVDFYGVISDPAASWDDIRAFRDEYALDFPILFDPSGDLASRLQPVVTPEAFVIDGDDRMIYRGRIDNRFAAPGSMRRKITSHDLKDFTRAAANRETVEPLSTDSVGCFFSAWKDDEAVTATYHRDIAPVLAANCVECHQTNGIAPFPLETYEQSNRWADMLAYVTAERLMPPWRPNPDHGRFRDERYLSERQVALFAAWAENDAPEGAVAERPAEVVLPDKDWRMGTPDLVLTMTEPFNVPATGDDVYRYFVIPSTMTEDKTVVGVDFKPGDPAVV
ncbi:MAG: redoxin domain-containing protein, partial [Geminicoccaceae bacterium]